VSQVVQRAEVRVEVEPLWPYSLPRMHGMDGLTRSPRGVVHRLIHEDGNPVFIRVAQLSSGNVLFGAQADHGHHAHRAIARMRRALGVDVDLREFHSRYRNDPLIGAPLRANPTLRTRGRPHAFEALSFAVCEQLIEYERGAAIERRLIWRLGRRCEQTGLRDSPPAAIIAAQSPAALQALDLSEGRAIALHRVAREVAAGRVDLSDPAHEAGWQRLRAIRGIGSWTLQCLALHGQGRLDQLPAGDLAYIKLVGRLRAGAVGAAGGPYERATEQQVQEFFAPYGRWAALAGLHVLVGAGSGATARMAA
jgi:3-methyladenine DNA glycosylase/8-oxoguanine DNA glycosylase